MIKATGQRPVHLRFDGGKVLITPEDAARFKMAARRAVRVLHREKVRDEAAASFLHEYLPRLHTWCQKNSDLVEACFFGTPTPHGLTIFVLGATPKYSFDLGDRISDFALQLENDGWSSDIIQISNGDGDEISTFFDPENALQIYAQPQATPGQG